MNKTIYHPWGGKGTDFFKIIDEAGGWPHNAGSLIMKHGDNRECYFAVTSKEVRNEWNATVAFADDYYLWKLSTTAKDKLRKELTQELKNKLIKYINS